MNTDTIILGERCTYSTDCQETGLNNNVLVVGGSGSGKTMSISEPLLLSTQHSSLIITVTKRRIIEKYKPLFTSRGYLVQDLNFVNPTAGTVGFDLLAYVRSYQDIRFIAQAIVKASAPKLETHADPYWDNAAISLFCAFIGYVLETKEHPTFADVLHMHNNLTYSESGSQITTNYDSAFAQLAKKRPSCFAVSCWHSFCQLPLRTASCVFGTLNTAIDSMFTPDIRRAISSKKTVNFKKLAQRKTVLFVTTSAVNPALSCYVNLFYGLAFKQLFEFAEQQPDGKLPIPVRVLCDDFATGSQILNFPEYISIFREKQLSTVILLQSESQLEAMYGYQQATTIINNCDTYVYMGGMDLKTCQNISLRLNTPLDEVLYMPIGQVDIFRRGQKPIVTTRYAIEQDALYQSITRQYEQRIASDKQDRK